MRMRVGCISARCEACGGEDFQPLADAPVAQELMCFGCGGRTTRRALLTQIADETVRRAQAFLESSRRQRQR
jgi:hypothetical protein